MKANFNFIFNNSSLHYETDKNKVAWFLADEIAKGLGYSHTYNMLRMINNYNKILLPTSNLIIPELGLNFTHIFNEYINSIDNFAPSLSDGANSSKIRNFYVISESGVYTVALNARSTRPEVQQFRYWVVQEVLPSIRMYGMYIDPNTRIALQNNPNLIHDYQHRIEELENIVNNNQSFIDLGKAVVDDRLSYSNINEIAYTISQALDSKIGIHTLIPLLKCNGVLQHRDDKLLLTQKTINQKLVRRIYNNKNNKWEYIFTNESIDRIIQIIKNDYDNPKDALDNRLLYELIDNNNSK